MAKTSRIQIDFKWPVGSAYKIENPDPLVSRLDPFAQMKEPSIVQVGSAQFERWPLENGSLHLRFARLADKPAAQFAEACRTFALGFGLLQTYAEDGASEPLSLWRDRAQTMRDSIDGLRRAKQHGALPDTGATITEASVQLMPDGRLAIRPRVLWDAMRLQLAQSITSGRDIGECKNCGEWFEIGGRGDHVRRVGSEFCSDTCRSKFNYREKRTAS
ncbi:hypothetical protein BRAS3843_1730011 [Bradyrhizobium sp. STM 3843]|uniref:hypothetical protein n=1 Tax=Bradyrhizobium sp. STM 3843 TaxID=551947 RepID=UPI000240711C|nr:hypothetical protein [Bradyrhizobium sp. STM 3843]CCE06442.1 hypothetical protein BRAS3843_1730011 [Bradyrhizobium sp. STM 3843]